MFLKIVMAVVILTVIGGIIALTGTVAPLLLIIKSAGVFILQFIGALFAIFLLGQIALVVWAKSRKVDMKVVFKSKAAPPKSGIKKVKMTRPLSSLEDSA